MTRPEPREEALAAVYAAEQGGRDGPDVAGLTGRGGALAEGLWANRAELDAAIEAASDRWRVHRMPVVDRNVLRLALYELRHVPDTPTAVIISEAVGLAKKFSTEKSGAFVNGVLSRLAREERGDDKARA